MAPSFNRQKVRRLKASATWEGRFDERRDGRIGSAIGRENRSWGYRRIAGALSNLGHEVSHQTVANVMKRHDLAPAPERGRTMSWQEFISSHMEVLAAVDFFTAEV